MRDSDQCKLVNATIYPEGRLDVLSKMEVSELLDKTQGKLYQTFRNCSLAVLNSGSKIDDGKELLERFTSFDIFIHQEERGVRLEVVNAPQDAFVDGEMIKGINDHLFSILRDVIYAHDEITGNPRFGPNVRDGVTNAVFHILRNAEILHPVVEPKLVVCWGGHSIGRVEYDYSKEVGYQLGLRGLDICTGCGPGAMKGPMKGAAVAHAKQRICGGRYLGISEPGIIAAEAPNPIVNELVVLPDIEKRLEAFVRSGHGIVVFPGGVGTAEEILYLLGILLHPNNKQIPFPLIFTGPTDSEEYFRRIDEFISATLGEEAQQRYQIVIGDPIQVGQEMKSGMGQVKAYRQTNKDAFYFNWTLQIDREFQQPFSPTHENMRNLELHKDQEVHMFAANLRRAFSGIVAGNVKEDGIRAVEQHGLYEIRGNVAIIEKLEELLTSFIEQQRMKLPGKEYIPCYRIVR